MFFIGTIDIRKIDRSNVQSLFPLNPLKEELSFDTYRDFVYPDRYGDKIMVKIIEFCLMGRWIWEKL
jgi:hypothetical protein